jgi:hypothetical protein
MTLIKERGKYPWFATILYSDVPICCGSYIGYRYVVTHVHGVRQALPSSLTSDITRQYFVPTDGSLKVMLGHTSVDDDNIVALQYGVKLIRGYVPFGLTCHRTAFKSNYKAYYRSGDTIYPVYSTDLSNVHSTDFSVNCFFTSDFPLIGDGSINTVILELDAIPAFDGVSPITLEPGSHTPPLDCTIVAGGKFTNYDVRHTDTVGTPSDFSLGSGTISTTYIEQYNKYSVSDVNFIKELSATLTGSDILSTSDFYRDSFGEVVGRGLSLLFPGSDFLDEQAVENFKIEKPVGNYRAYLGAGPLIDVQGTMSDALQFTYELSGSDLILNEGDIGAPVVVRRSDGYVQIGMVHVNPFNFLLQTGSRAPIVMSSFNGDVDYSSLALNMLLSDLINVHQSDLQPSDYMCSCSSAPPEFVDAPGLQTSLDNFILTNMTDVTLIENIIDDVVQLNRNVQSTTSDIGRVLAIADDLPILSGYISDLAGFLSDNATYATVDSSDFLLNLTDTYTVSDLSSDISLASDSIIELLSWNSDLYTPLREVVDDINVDLMSSVENNAPSDYRDALYQQRASSLKLVFYANSTYYPELGAGDTYDYDVWLSSDSASVIHNSDGGYFILRTPENTTAIRQSRWRFPHREKICYLHGCLCPTVGDGGYSRIGLGEERDGETKGLFFSLISDDIYITELSDRGEIHIPQSGWNIDKLDGTGRSGINIRKYPVVDRADRHPYVVDLRYRSNIYFFSFEKQAVRFGLLLNGVPREVHRSSWQCEYSTILRDLALPIRWESHSGGTTKDMYMIDAAIYTPTTESQTYLSKIFRKEGIITMSPSKPGQFQVFSIRPTEKYKSAVIKFERVSMIVLSNHTLQWQLTKNALLTSDVNEVSVKYGSTTEVLQSLIFYRGGETFYTGVVTQNRRIVERINSIVPIGFDIQESGARDTITFGISNIDPAKVDGSVKFWFQVIWEETLEL